MLEIIGKVEGYMTQVMSLSEHKSEMIAGNFRGKDIISLDQICAEDIHILFNVAHRMKRIALNNEPSHLLAGYLVSLLFFEPSSRTFGSFAAAVKRLGGQTLEIQNPEAVTSTYKGETF